MPKQICEPCPFCEEEVRFDLGDLSAKCVSCFYTGPTDDNEAAAHNRLSRIVRAAEELAKALRDEQEHDYDCDYTDIVSSIEMAIVEAVEQAKALEEGGLE